MLERSDCELSVEALLDAVHRRLSAALWRNVFAPADGPPAIG